jgi:hypothetical protein
MIVDFFAEAYKFSSGGWGIKIGWSDTEFGIKSGGLLTVFGDIIYNTKDGKLRMDNPLYLLNEKSALLSKIKKEIQSSNNWIIGLSIPCLLAGALAIWLGLQRKKRKQTLQRQRSNMVVDFSNLADDYKCIICVERPRNLIYKPCLHFCVCDICSHEIKSNNCPVCKKEFTDVIEVNFHR